MQIEKERTEEIIKALQEGSKRARDFMKQGKNTRNY